MSQDKQKAVWTAEETSALVEYLYENKSQYKDGNFDIHTFAAAAESISHLLKKGPKKSGTTCKTKWSSVSDPRASCSRN
jgi:hypothetical protein